MDRPLLRRLSPLIGRIAYSPRPSVLPVPMLVSAGVEAQTDPERYQWDGLRRSWDEKCPRDQEYVVIQYTLDGEGLYQDARGEQRLGPDRGFIALVPSEHRYGLPPGRTWTFCWFAVAHPQLVARLKLLVQNHGATFASAPTSALVQRLTEVVEGLNLRTFRDDFALEAALWDTLHELERQADRRAHPPEPKHELLDRVRAIILEDLTQEPSTADIARRLSWHRVHFAQRFREITGLTPGAWITSLRLEEARRHLTHGTAPLDEVAKAVGLGSAARLCRLFRRTYGSTPGQFRGSTRGQGPEDAE